MTETEQKTTAGTPTETETTPAATTAAEELAAAKTAFDAKIAELQAKLDAAEAKYIRDLGAYMRGDTPTAGGGEDKSIDALVKKLSK